MSYAIIASEGDFFFFIESHNEVKKATERSEMYFNAAFQPPYDNDLLEKEFTRIIPLGESDFNLRRKLEQSANINDHGNVFVVEEE